MESDREDAPRFQIFLWEVVDTGIFLFEGTLYNVFGEIAKYIYILCILL